MNTRFNPTVNGRLHLGHLYLILLNQHTAEKNGGDLVCRFDDIQDYWIDRIGRGQMDRNCEAIREDLEWMKIRAVYTYQSRQCEENEKMIQSLEPLSRFLSEPGQEDRTRAIVMNQERPYPYVPYLTAVKVAQDYRERIDPVIRGDDLTTEFALYCHFCHCLAIPIPQMYFVPKLVQPSGEDLTDMSKTAGENKIIDFKNAGYTPEELVAMLGRCCLKIPEHGWNLNNVKKTPILRIE